MAVPTLPAPAMATFMPGRPSVAASASAGGPVRRPPDGDEALEGAVGHHQVEHVAVLAHQVAEVEPDHAGPGHRHQGDLAGDPRSARRLPAQRSGSRARPARGCRSESVHSRLDLVGHQSAADLVDGPGTVATVGMPRRR